MVGGAAGPTTHRICSDAVRRNAPIRSVQVIALTDLSQTFYSTATRTICQTDRRASDGVAAERGWMRRRMEAGTIHAAQDFERNRPPQSRGSYPTDGA